MAITKYYCAVMITVIMLLANVSAIHAQSRIDMNDVRIDSQKIIRDSRRKQTDFFTKIRLAVQDLNMRLRQLKLKANDSKQVMRENRNRANEARMNSRIAQQDAKRRLREAQAHQKEQMRMLRDMARR